MVEAMGADAIPRPEPPKALQRDLVANAKGENSWAEKDTPAELAGSAKVAQGAVLVQAVLRSSSPEELEDPLTTLCELGREDGAAEVLIQTKAAEQVTEALLRLDSPSGACFLLADLCRILSRSHPSEVPTQSLGALVEAVRANPDDQPLFVTCAMLWHNLTRGERAAAVLECGAPVVLTAGLHTLIHDPTAVAHAAAVLSALAIGTGNSVTPEQVALVSIQVVKWRVLNQACYRCSLASSST